MLTPQASRTQRGQWSLIGSLVAVAILITLTALYLPRLLKPSASSGQEQSAIQDANGVACTEYISQFNQASQMYKMDHNGQPPPSLAALENAKYGITSDMINSPGCSFQIDPATGTVSNGPPAAGANGARPTANGAAPGPAGGTRGPGGVTIPNIPDAGGGM